MASGDAQRTWFPEMIGMLKDGWCSSMSLDALISLRDRLDATLQTIRTDRHILPAMMHCPRCQKPHRSAPPRVSVRAMILALERFGIAPQSEIKSLKKLWNKHRKQHQLDMYGKKEQVRTTH